MSKYDKAMNTLNTLVFCGNCTTASMKGLKSCNECDMYNTKKIAKEVLQQAKDSEIGCDFCNNFDFDKVCVTNCFGNLTISLCGGNKIPNESERFKLCPMCGRKLQNEEREENKASEQYLYDWLIHSVDNTPPVWTDEHIKELLRDFDIYIKNKPTESE